jgi:UDP-N-acetylmuramyl pentapeptide phosphotransferase/UDP-N-acetylglucosamine-1-phosphate transferase
MRGTLVLGAVLGFVAVVLGLTWEALAMVGVLCVLERAEARS